MKITEIKKTPTYLFADVITISIPFYCQFINIFFLFIFFHTVPEDD